MSEMPMPQPVDPRPQIAPLPTAIDIKPAVVQGQPCVILAFHTPQGVSVFHMAASDTPGFINALKDAANEARKPHILTPEKTLIVPS